MGSSAIAPAPSFVEEPCLYTFQRTFTGNERQLGLPVQIDPDSDFMLTGIHGTSTGLYTINFRLPGGRLFANNAIRSDNLIGTAIQPTAIGPAPIYRAGGIGPTLDILESTGSSNTLEICFTGIRRLRVAGA